MATETISAGEYLRKRREAAGLGVIQAAANLAALPWASRRPGADERQRLVRRINAAEAGALPFSRDHAELLRSVFAFDVDVYFALLAQRDGTAPAPELPGLCRECACSWYDPCFDPHTGVGCAWAEQPGPASHGLCTTCADRAGQGVCTRCDRRVDDPVIRACTDCSCPLAERAPQDAVERVAA